MWLPAFLSTLDRLEVLELDIILNAHQLYLPAVAIPSTVQHVEYTALSTKHLSAILTAPSVTSLTLLIDPRLPTKNRMSSSTITSFAFSGINSPRPNLTAIPQHLPKLERCFLSFQFQDPDNLVRTQVRKTADARENGSYWLSR